MCVSFYNNKRVSKNIFSGKASAVLPPGMKGLQRAAGAAGAARAQEGGALAGGGQAVSGDTFPHISALFHLSRAR